VDYGWPGNVRELRNLIESMVVLAPGREITVADIPRGIRDGGSSRLLPVPIGPILREGAQAEGRELEFIVRSLVELKLQVEELRRRLDNQQQAPVSAPVLAPGGMVGFVGERALEPAGVAPPPVGVTLTPGMTMAEIERVAIESALRQTRGNRRKAAEMLAIGERTMYRKLKEYDLDQIGDET